MKAILLGTALFVLVVGALAAFDVNTPPTPERFVLELFERTATALKLSDAVRAPVRSIFSEQSWRNDAITRGTEPPSEGGEGEGGENSAVGVSLVYLGMETLRAAFSGFLWKLLPFDTEGCTYLDIMQGTDYIGMCKDAPDLGVLISTDAANPACVGAEIVYPPYLLNLCQEAVANGTANAIMCTPKGSIQLYLDAQSSPVVTGLFSGQADCTGSNELEAPADPFPADSDVQFPDLWIGTLCLPLNIRGAADAVLGFIDELSANNSTSVEPEVLEIIDAVGDITFKINGVQVNGIGVSNGTCRLTGVLAALTSPAGIAAMSVGAAALLGAGILVAVRSSGSSSSLAKR